MSATSPALVRAADAPVDFRPGEVRGATGLGVIALMMSGLLPLFLGALEGEHRLSAAGIGQVATLELLSSALCTGLAGVCLRARHLRVIGVAASLLLAAASAATVGAQGAALMAVRTLAGGPEGVLLWIVVGLIARSPTPERRAGLLFTAMAGSQLLCAVVLALAVLPRFGADGGYALMSGLSAAGALAALLLPDSYSALPAEAEGGAPPLKGWIALLAIFVLQAAIAGAGMYIVPLALQAGLNDGVAQTAISCALAFEVLGAGVATAISGRTGFMGVIVSSLFVLMGSLVIYAVNGPGWLFVAASASVGFCALLIMPFVVPLTIRVDPSRRAAVQIGAAQLLGGAVGPMLASLVITARDARGAVYLAEALLVASLCAILAVGRQARSG